MTEITTRLEQTDAGDRVVAEVAVPGEQEDVWRTVATASGIEAWLVPAKVAEEVGGEITLDYGALGTARGVVTDWQPPTRFGWQESGPAGERPAWKVAIEIDPAPRRRHTVRVTCETEPGGGPTAERTWREALENLVYCLEFYPGQEATTMVVDLPIEQALEDVLPRLRRELGLEDYDEGDRIVSPGGRGLLSGRIRSAGPERTVIETDAPAPGVLAIAVVPRGQGALVRVHGWLFGPQAPIVGPREERLWKFRLGRAGL